MNHAANWTVCRFAEMCSEMNGRADRISEADVTLGHGTDNTKLCNKLVMTNNWTHQFGQHLHRQSGFRFYCTVVLFNYVLLTVCAYVRRCSVYCPCGLAINNNNSKSYRTQHAAPSLSPLVTLEQWMVRRKQVVYWHQRCHHGSRAGLQVKAGIETTLNFKTSKSTWNNVEHEKEGWKLFYIPPEPVKRPVNGLTIDGNLCLYI